MGIYVDVAGQVVLKTKKDYDRFVEWLEWQGWLFEGDWTDILDEESRGHNFFPNELKVKIPMMAAQNKFHNITGCFTDISSYVDHSGQENIEYDKSQTMIRMYSEDGGINVREFIGGQTYDKVIDGNYDDLLRMFGEEFTRLFCNKNHDERVEEWNGLCEDYKFGGTILEEVREMIEEWMYSREDEVENETQQ